MRVVSLLLLTLVKRLDFFISFSRSDSVLAWILLEQLQQNLPVFLIKKLEKSDSSYPIWLTLFSLM